MIEYKNMMQLDTSTKEQPQFNFKSFTSIAATSHHIGQQEEEQNPVDKME
jgi:hypothetical protein